jgi:hypothetical protein
MASQTLPPSIVQSCSYFYYTNAMAIPKRFHIILVERDLWGGESLHVTADPAVNAASVIEINCCGEARQVRG